jgi:hypothetical protein
MQGMDEDFSNLLEAIQTKRNELGRERKLVLVLENRYARLSPSVAAWGKQKLRDDQPLEEMEIDGLLRQLPKEQPLPELLIGAELKAMTIANANIDVHLTKMRRDLNQGMQTFAVEETRIKRQIQKQKEDCSRREKGIIDEISDLKRKLAQKAFK